MSPMSFKDSCAEAMRDHNRRAGIQSGGGYVPYKTADEIARFRESHEEPELEPKEKKKSRNQKWKCGCPKGHHFLDCPVFKAKSPKPREPK